MEQHILAWITQYGYLAIFLSLVLGIVGLPIPDETILTFSGYLIYTGHLSFPLALATAAAGSFSGITISYTLGRLFGMPLVHRYGKYVRVTEDHIHKAQRFFDKLGAWSLTVGYFVPGVRHFTAFAAGGSGLRPRRFVIFAYSGAIIWISSFLGLGYFLGERWEAVQKNVEHYILWASILCGVAIAGYFAWRKWGRKSSPAG